MAIINNLPYSMEQDRIEQVKANSVHVDDNFNTLLNAVNNKIDKDGTMTVTGDIPMNSHKITTLATPTASGDAATKGYVDSAITTASAPATVSTPGHVIIGSNIAVAADGTISVPLATTSNPGVVQLGKTDTSANAETSAVRNTVITNTVPVSGTDGVIYFVYSL
jgi:predicted RecA/RadA family phage recombinase